MQQRSVIDENGAWVISQAAYPMQDNASGVYFYPGVPTKVKVTPWMQQQSGWLVPWADPDAPAVMRVAKPK